jgi:hypothetical protein
MARVPLLTMQIYPRLGTDYAASLSAFCTVAMTPMPWVFWMWVKTLEGRSKYEKDIMYGWLEVRGCSRFSVTNFRVSCVLKVDAVAMSAFVGCHAYS